MGGGLGGLLGLALDVMVVGAVTCAVCGLAHQTADHARYSRGVEPREQERRAPARTRRGGYYPRMLEEGWW